MAYIKKASQEKGCLFCRVSRSKGDKRNLLLFRGDSAFVVMNLFPYNPGHLMVAPFRHVARLEKLSDQEREELLGLAGRSIEILDRLAGPHGYNLGMNLGRVAGAGVLGHLHLHIVPRWDGDTNFMPLLGDAKVIPEALVATFEKLARDFNRTRRR
jgi:ATP adenylyltransferase